MAVDIEVTTAPGFEFPNAARESDRIIAIAIADSAGFTTVLSGAEMSEADLLAECGRLIRERDPDVLEGHNIFRFDLEYIEARARRHKVPLALGARRLRADRAALAHAGGRADHRLPPLRGRRPSHRGHVDPRPALRRRRPRPRVLRPQGRRAPLRHRRAGAHLPAARRHPPHLPRGSRAADGLCARRRDRDAGALGAPLAALLRPGPGAAAVLRVGGAPRQRDQDRRAPDARVPAPASRRARAVGGQGRGRRLHGRAAHGRGPAGAPRRRHLALPVAHARRGRSRPPATRWASSRSCSAISASSGWRPSGSHARRRPRPTGRSSARSSRPSRS